MSGRYCIAHAATGVVLPGEHDSGEALRALRDLRRAYDADRPTGRQVFRWVAIHADAVWRWHGRGSGYAFLRALDEDGVAQIGDEFFTS